jgi:nucleoside-diphosphate-sugar epimerase
MKVTVVGNAGFIGGALARKLRATGCDMYLPSRADLADGAPKGGWGMLVWAAGLTASFRQRPFDTVRAHVSDLATLLAGRLPDGVVYLSSTRVYMRASGTLETAAVPSYSADPSDLYNISKLMGESLCLNSGLDRVKIARLSNIIGPNEGARDTFLGALCREAKQGRILVQTDPASQKDYLWIEDAANYLAAMTTGDESGVFNVARGVQTSHQEWADAIARASGVAVSYLPSAPPGGFPAIDTRHLVQNYGPPDIDPLDRITEILHPL